MEAFRLKYRGGRSTVSHLCCHPTLISFPSGVCSCPTRHAAEFHLQRSRKKRDALHGWCDGSICTRVNHPGPGRGYPARIVSPKQGWGFKRSASGVNKRERFGAVRLVWRLDASAPMSGRQTGGRGGGHSRFHQPDQGCNEIKATKILSGSDHEPGPANPEIFSIGVRRLCKGIKACSNITNPQENSNEVD